MTAMGRQWRAVPARAEKVVVMALTSRLGKCGYIAAISWIAVSGGCSLAPWAEDEPPPPAWAGKAPRGASVESGGALLTNQRILEPEQAAVLDQLSDAEEIQKNVGVERVDGEDPCMTPNGQHVSCGREFEGRAATGDRPVLPEVTLQMMQADADQNFDPARAVDDIGRTDERRRQELLAVGEQYLQAGQSAGSEQNATVPEAPIDGIFIEPSIPPGSVSPKP